MIGAIVLLFELQYVHFLLY